MKIAFLFLVFCVGESASSAITSSPGLKRRHIGDSCEFQWTVNGEVTSYEIRNISTGDPPGIALTTDRSNHSRVITASTSSSLIRLSIRNIHLWDAGNYSLSVTEGTTTTISAGALLFVYDNAGTSAVTPNATPPAIEDRSIALTCTVTTRSRPSNLPSILPPLYYFWRLGSTDNLGNISGGHPKKPNGEILTRYNITNGGRTLVISPVQASDRQAYSCWGWEEGARHPTATSPAYQLAVNFRPIIFNRQPRSGRFNGDISATVTFSFQFSAEPAVVLAPTWALTSSLGATQTLPPQFESLNLSNPFSVSFSLSAAYYGRYTFSVSNSVGTTSDSFSVVPPGPPDAPSHLTVLYKTFRLLSVEWNCQWFNGRQQTTMLRLKDLETSEFLDAHNRTEKDQSCYNISRTHLFENNLQADRDYEVSLWSTNNLGSSEVITKTVRTTKRFQLILSHKTISIDANEAKINFETMYGSMAVLSVTCCAEETGTCTTVQFQVNASSTQVTMTGLPKAGIVYLFDFTAFGKAANGKSYYLGMIRGVKVHRDGNPIDPVLIAVIVLGVLLGITFLSLIGCLVAFVYYKLRQRREEQGESTEGPEMNSDLNELKPRKPEEKEQQRTTTEQQKPAKRPLPALKFRSKAQDPPPKIPSPDEDIVQETYEVMDRQDEGETYTPLDQPPPPARTKKQRNYYS